MDTTSKQIKLIVSKIVNKIHEVVDPVEIYLFGSALKDSFNPNSDLDFLVVVRNGMPKRKTTQEIYRKLVEIGFAADIILITEEELEAYRNEPYYIIKTAVREGELIYG